MSGAGLLAGEAAGPQRWFVVHVVAAFGALLLVPAALGLRTLATSRGRRLANLALLTAGIAAVALAIGFIAEASVLRLAVTSGLDGAAADRLAEALARSPELFAVPVGILAATLTGVLLAAGLLTARTVPAWKAWLYLLATVATAAGPPGTTVGAAAVAAAAVSAALLARHVTAGAPVTGCAQRPGRRRTPGHERPPWQVDVKLGSGSTPGGLRAHRGSGPGRS